MQDGKRPAKAGYQTPAVFELGDAQTLTTGNGVQNVDNLGDTSTKYGDWGQPKIQPREDIAPESESTEEDNK